MAVVEPGCQRTEAEQVRVQTEEEPEGRRSSTKAKGVEGRDTADGLEVHGGGWATDQGETKGTREPSGADMLMGRGGVMSSETWGGAKESVHQDEAGGREVTDGATSVGNQRRGSRGAGRYK